MAGSLFKGLFEHFGKYTPLPFNVDFDTRSMYLGQVLSVVTGEELEEAVASGEVSAEQQLAVYKYMGVISVKLQGNDDIKYETTVGRFAFPIDRSTFRLPIAGELVLVVLGYFSDEDGKRKAGHFYTQVITGALPTRDASQPFAITTRDKVEVPTGPLSLLADQGALNTRFEKRLSHNIHTVKKEGKVYPTMREGDKILEGRFGGSIRFTSTISKEGVWSTSEGTDSITKGSSDGNPFLIIKATKPQDQSTESDQNTPRLEDDDINVDESSIYLNTSQYLPLNVASSKTMYTWGYEVQRLDMPLTLEDPSRQLQSYFPDKYDPNFELTANAEFPFQPEAFDDNLTGDKAGPLTSIPYNPANNSQQESVIISTLNATFALGESQHMCARGTYNHAFNLAAILKGQQPTKGQTQAAGGNANAGGYFNRLTALGFRRYDQGSNLTRAQLDNTLKNGPGSPWGLGDVVTYWSNDGGADESNRRYGHTQMYVGSVTGLGNWTTDNKYNYNGSYFVYRNRSANSWNLIVFKAPQA